MAGWRKQQRCRHFRQRCNSGRSTFSRVFCDWRCQSLLRSKCCHVRNGICNCHKHGIEAAFNWLKFWKAHRRSGWNTSQPDIPI